MRRRTTAAITVFVMILTMLTPLAAAAAPVDDLRAIEPGALLSSVKERFGDPEIRSLRSLSGAQVEDLYYRLNASELIRLVFINGILRSKEVKAAGGPAPIRHELRVEGLQRRYQVSQIQLGWTPEQVKRVLKPDDVTSSETMTTRTPAWPGGELWHYYTGPYVTVLRVDQGKVVEVTDKIVHIDPDAIPAPTEQEARVARKFWKGVGTVLAIGAAAYIIHEALEAEPGGSVVPVSGGGGSSRDVITSQIDGEFTGWSGNTVFSLVNGQIWRQSRYAYHYYYAYRPKVTIIRNSSGRYEMVVHGVGNTVEVERVR